MHDYSTVTLSDMRRLSVDVLDPDPTVEVDCSSNCLHDPVSQPSAGKISRSVLIAVNKNVMTDFILLATAEAVSLWLDLQACAECTLHQINPPFFRRA